MKIKVKAQNSKKTFDLDVTPQDTIAQLKLSISQFDESYQSEIT